MSLWQIAQAAILTLTSPGPGSASSTSSMRSGAPNLRHTAARVFMSAPAVVAAEITGRRGRTETSSSRAAKQAQPLGGRAGFLCEATARSRAGCVFFERVPVPDSRLLRGSPRISSTISGASNSLLVGKNAGNFADSAAFCEICLENTCKCNGLRENSLRDRAGNFFARAGKYTRFTPEAENPWVKLYENCR